MTVDWFVCFISIFIGIPIGMFIGWFSIDQGSSAMARKIFNSLLLERQRAVEQMDAYAKAQEAAKNGVKKNGLQKQSEQLPQAAVVGEPADRGREIKRVASVSGR